MSTVVIIQGGQSPASQREVIQWSQSPACQREVIQWGQSPASQVCFVRVGTCVYISRVLFISVVRLDVAQRKIKH